MVVRPLDFFPSGSGGRSASFVYLVHFSPELALVELTRAAPANPPSTLLRDHAVLAGVTEVATTPCQGSLAQPLMKVARAALPRRPLRRSAALPWRTGPRLPLPELAAPAGGRLRRPSPAPMVL
jgi:hypothetical protein